MTYFLKRVWDRFPRMFCRHEWKVSKFQALGSYSLSYRCEKCGEYRHDD